MDGIVEGRSDNNYNPASDILILAMVDLVLASRNAVDTFIRVIMLAVQPDKLNDILRLKKTLARSEKIARSPEILQ